MQEIIIENNNIRNKASSVKSDGKMLSVKTDIEVTMLIDIHQYE